MGAAVKREILQSVFAAKDDDETLKVINRLLVALRC